MTGADIAQSELGLSGKGVRFNPIPRPDPAPMDCNGHGTHVSGIVGAKAAAPGGVTGVASRVLFGAYRVFGCDGSTTTDIILAAMERALADRMQVLNMSLGAAFLWPQSPTAAASDRLVKRGMVVVASIGNSGGAGLYSSGAPGDVQIMPLAALPDRSIYGYIVSTPRRTTWSSARSKALGDENNPAHYETFTTPVIRVLTAS